MACVQVNVTKSSTFVWFSVTVTASHLHYATWWWHNVVSYFHCYRYCVYTKVALPLHYSLFHVYSLQFLFRFNSFHLKKFSHLTVTRFSPLQFKRNWSLMLPLHKCSIGSSAQNDSACSNYHRFCDIFTHVPTEHCSLFNGILQVSFTPKFMCFHSTCFICFLLVMS
jgi:hypothetical protein